MNKDSVLVIAPSDKNPRSYYTEAYSQLRGYYAGCNSGRFSDDVLMEWKHGLWLKYGKYLDLAWRHHFSRQVVEATGQGTTHGWKSVVRRETWLDASYRRAIIAAGW